MFGTPVDVPLPRTITLNLEHSLYNQTEFSAAQPAFPPACPTLGVFPSNNSLSAVGTN
jgi:hypothetical protein